MNDTCYIVTSWEDNLFNNIKQFLLSIGVDSKNIIRISERYSRPKCLNKAWVKAKEDNYQYVAFIDEDVVIRDNHVFERFKEIIEATEAAGVIANPKLFQQGQSFFEIPYDMPPSTSWRDSIEQCTSNLTSLNCALFRIDLPVKFDEDYFGNQNFDVDFGLELANFHEIIYVDKATLVLARANDYFSKSFSYHLAVARNLHIFLRKWSDIKNWLNVEEYNRKFNNEIPTIEELTHWNEIKQMQYCYAYNRDGIARCYLNPRFGGLVQAASFVQNIENNLQNIQNMIEYVIPHQGALPVFNLKK